MFEYQVIKYFNLGFISVPSYAVFANIAFFVGTFFIISQVRKAKLQTKHGLGITLAALIGMLFGAKIMYYFGPYTWWHNFSIWDRIISTLQVWESGLVFYGGLIGTLAGMWLYGKIKKIDLAKYIDIMAMALGLVIFISRIGCYFAGCCRGTKTDVPWAIIRDGVSIHPAQIYSSLNGLMLFFTSLWVNKRVPPGFTTLYVLVYYSATRFIIEFFRTAIIFWNLSTSQIVSLLLFTVVLIVTIRKLYALR